MPEPITHHQLAILAYVGKNPNVSREQLLKVTKATEADLGYLELHDMIREREVGHYRIAHFGEMVLRRGL
jgi:hypothetical protein